ncbi:hypothetical protein N8955_01480 [bacterium]|jgi:hypothetical protein|nr:hypothetical protein [Hellea sp.]MDA7807383.1 hypothetical protein [bacterium]MDA9047935.1 hypothetical protein [Hellea sp.]MDA9225143.1 hypothetical protein [bacterium]
MKQNDKVWEMVTNLILELLIDAREQGIELLSFEEVCVMLGVDDVTLMAELERDENYILNQEYLDKLKDPEVRKAMIESFKATKH